MVSGSLCLPSGRGQLTTWCFTITKVEVQGLRIANGRGDLAGRSPRFQGWLSRKLHLSWGYACQAFTCSMLCEMGSTVEQSRWLGFYRFVISLTWFLWSCRCGRASLVGGHEDLRIDVSRAKIHGQYLDRVAVAISSSCCTAEILRL